MSKITLGDIQIDVIRKRIKHVHLSVYPPSGRVRISAPGHIKLETLRIYAISKLRWIKKQQDKIRTQEREPPREYVDRESHYYLGRRYLMKHKDHQTSYGVHLRADVMEVRMRGEATPVKAKGTLQNWYRNRLRELIQGYVDKWEPILGVNVGEFGIKAMKTRWGTCNPRARRIWLNLELIKKPKECIEYVTVHEMAHLLVKSHGLEFRKLMDEHVPKWKSYRQELNRSPLRHESWEY